MRDYTLPQAITATMQVLSIETATAEQRKKTAIPLHPTRNDSKHPAVSATLIPRDLNSWQGMLIAFDVL